MTDSRMYVVTPQEFHDVLRTFLSKMKKNGLVDNYSYNKDERMFIVNLNPEAEIQGNRDEFIQLGLFANGKQVLKDMGVEDIDEKIIQFPLCSTQVDEKNPNTIRVHY